MEAGLVDAVDLIALVWVPAGADHARWKSTRVRVNDGPHDVGGWLNRGEVAELVSLSIHVETNVLGNGLGVGWGTWTLAVDAVVDGLKFVRNTVADVHILNREQKHG